MSLMSFAVRRCRWQASAYGSLAPKTPRASTLMQERRERHHRHHACRLVVTDRALAGNSPPLSPRRRSRGQLFDDGNEHRFGQSACRRRLSRAQSGHLRSQARCCCSGMGGDFHADRAFAHWRDAQSGRGQAATVRIFFYGLKRCRNTRGNPP